MAEIVLGLATSHSPNVSTAPDLWSLHAAPSAVEASVRNGRIPLGCIARGGAYLGQVCNCDRIAPQASMI